MRKEYVKPAMQSEEFLANVYCSTCGDLELTGTLTVKPSDWLSDNNRKKWSDPSDLVTESDETLSHTFNQDEDHYSRTGNYWICTDSDSYYLEHSTYFSNLNNMATFFLYKETNNIPGLQTSNSPRQTWPYEERRKDLCVAQVSYSYDSIPVVNS